MVGRMKLLGVALGLVAGLGLSVGAFATEILLDQGAAVISGGTASNFVSVNYTMNTMLNNDASRVDGAGASATWTPGVTGTYDLWTDWWIYNGMQTYTINYNGGVRLVTVDSMKAGPQGASGTWVDGAGSGYYYLGRYTLNASSTVAITNNTSLFFVDALRLATPKDIFVVDERSALASTPGDWETTPAPYALSSDPGVTWAFDRSGTADTLTYYPHQTLAGAQIKLSWAGNSGGSANSAVKYWLDPDISNGSTADWVLLATINDNFDNTQTGGAGSWSWSGWYTVSGTYNLTDNSVIVLDTNGSTRTTADVIGIVAPAPSGVPEPATLMLLGTGALGAIGFIRRWRIQGR